MVGDIIYKMGQGNVEIDIAHTVWPGRYQVQVWLRGERMESTEVDGYQQAVDTAERALGYWTLDCVQMTRTRLGG